MKKNKLTLAAIAMSVSMLLAACGGNGGNAGGVTPPPSDGSVDTNVSNPVDPQPNNNVNTSEQSVVLSLGSETAVIDPGLTNAVDAMYILNNMFEGLYYTVDGSTMPAAAESLDISEDATVYTFTLRDANWSDGQPVTAHDFVFAWRRNVNPLTNSPRINSFDQIKNGEEIRTGIPNENGEFFDLDGNPLYNENGDPLTVNDLGIEAIDDKTLVVTLRQPSTTFLRSTNDVVFMPLREDVVGDDITGAWASDPTKILSNGPFILSQHNMGESIVLSQNPYYWDKDAVTLENVTFRFISDPSTALTAFRAGELHYAENFPLDETSNLIRSGEAMVFDVLGVNFYVINNTTEGPIQDWDVRRALSVAIDREAISNVRGRGEPTASGLIPYGFIAPDGTDFRDMAVDHDMVSYARPDLARELLEEAGFEFVDGKIQNFPVYEIAMNSGGGHELVAQIIQDNWAELGIETTIEVQEWAVFQETRRALDYNGFARHGTTASTVDPGTFLLSYRMDNPATDTGIQNQELHDAIVAAEAVVDPQARFEAWVEVERLLMEDGTVIPLSYTTRPALVREDFHGFYVDPLGRIILKYAYIAE